MAYQAIITKYLGPTNVRGSRVKATAQAGSVITHWDYELDIDGNHRAAAEALCVKFGWVGPHHGKLHMGGLPGSGYVFVFEDKE